MICNACAGESFKVIGDKSMPKTCKDCTAEHLIKDKNNRFGLFAFERAALQCSCLANNHQGETLTPENEEFTRITEVHKAQTDKLEAANIQTLHYMEEQKEEDERIYAERREELKELDKDGPEWILEKDEEIITDDN